MCGISYLLLKVGNISCVAEATVDGADVGPVCRGGGGVGIVGRCVVVLGVREAISYGNIDIAIVFSISSGGRVGGEGFDDLALVDGES